MLIETDRLYLRTLDENDCTEAYVAWLNDPDVSRFLETRHEAQDLPAIRDFVRTVNGRDNEFLFGIFLKEGDRHIGNIKVGPIGRHHPVADVSLLIGAREARGRGFASESISAVSRYAFEHLGVQKLAASMYAENHSSYRAFVKAGYRQEGLRRNHYLFEGHMFDIIELGLTPNDVRGD